MQSLAPIVGYSDWTGLVPEKKHVFHQSEVTHCIFIYYAVLWLKTAYAIADMLKEHSSISPANALS